MTQRPTKFRAWDTALNTMILVDVLEWLTNHLPHMGDVPGLAYLKGHTDTEWRITDKRIESSGGHPPEHFILMQFTGLHDKYGKEIWEGDIVTFGCDEDKTIHQVTWGGNYPAFDLEPSTDMETNTFSFVYDGAEGYELEVIGNIYENPDLLKQNI